VEQYLLFEFFRQEPCKLFVINSILNRRPRSDVCTICVMRN